MLDENLYGDAYEFISLLEAVGLRVLRLDVTNNAYHLLLPDEVRLRTADDDAGCLTSERIDTVLLHWSEDDFEHYCISMRPSTGEPWSSTMAEVRCNILEELRSAPLCCALQARLDAESTAEEVRVCVPVSYTHLTLPTN